MGTRWVSKSPFDRSQRRVARSVGRMRVVAAARNPARYRRPTPDASKCALVWDETSTHRRGRDGKSYVQQPLSWLCRRRHPKLGPEPERQSRQTDANQPEHRLGSHSQSSRTPRRRGRLLHGSRQLQERRMGERNLCRLQYAAVHAGNRVCIRAANRTSSITGTSQSGSPSPTRFSKTTKAPVISRISI